MSGIYNAVVQFFQGGTLVAQATTNSGGEYSVNLPEGIYTMNVIYPSDPGYTQALDHVAVSDPGPTSNGSVVPVTGIDVSPGSNTTVSVYSVRTVITAGAPVAVSGSISNNRVEDNTVVLSIPLTAFSYPSTGTHLKLMSLPTSGVLKYNGTACTVNQEIVLSSGALEFPLTYESSQTTFTAYNAPFTFQLKVSGNSTYSNTATLTIANTAFNSTVLQPYMAYSATAIKTRSDIPTQAFTVNNGSSVTCWALLPSQAASVLGSAETTWSGLFALPIGDGASAAINRWSNFSPVEWYVSSGSLTYRKKSTSDYRAAFAGYNHGAVATGWFNSAHLNPIWMSSGGEATFIADITIGELDYTKIPGVAGIAMTIWDGLDLVAFSIEDINSLYDVAHLSCNLSGITQGKTYTGRIYLCNNLTSFMPSLGNAICQIPNVTDYEVDVNVYVQTSLVVQPDWTVVNPGINLALATVSFNGATYANSLASLVVNVRLIKQYDGSYEDTVFYSGPYVANTDLGQMSEVVHSSTPIPDYGYTAYLQFYESE